MTYVFVFGDSITWGAFDDEGGWVERLKIYLDNVMKSKPKLWYAVYNLGVDGDTTEMVLRRFELELKARLEDEPKEEVIIIFQIGTNDSSLIESSNTHRANKERFRENIEALIEKSRNFSKKIVFLGLLPVNDKLTMPVPWDTSFGKIDYEYKYSQDYNSILRVICETQKVMYIDLFEEIQKKDYKKLLKDGLHPNTKGHEFIFNIVKSFLEKNKMIVNLGKVN